MRKFFILLVLAIFIFITFSSYTFAEGNLSGSSDGQRITLAQHSNGKSSENDRAFWDSVKDSNNPDEFRAYLEQFPKGVFAPLARARLKALKTRGVQKHPGTVKSAPQVASPREIKRDNSFIAYDNETVLDTRTNLMWAAKDNGNNTNWYIAKSYCENYRGGGYSDWRMPKLYELAGLYDMTKTYKAYAEDCSVSYLHLTDLIRLTCTAVWASETRGPEAAFFGFVTNGGVVWNDRTWCCGRALPGAFRQIGYLGI